MNSNAPSKTGTILVVDDDPDFLLQEKIWLEQGGFTVITADSAGAARDIIRQTPFDLAVVDLMMEEVDAGFTLCHQIKRKLPGKPVILVTAVSNETGIEFDSTTREEQAWVKADAVLAKPVRFEQLQAEVDRLLGD